MKYRFAISILLITVVFSACVQLPETPTRVESSEETVSSPSPIMETAEVSPTDTNELGQTPLPTPPTTPNPFASLYGCEMELTFSSGPLESKTTQFDVLGEDYFSDKGDKFKPGKGTSIFYQDLHYFIIHSAYVNGNILRPMEAEFLRKYLEYWGSSGNAYTQGQIDNLIGSEVTWSCDGSVVFETKISGITRLSHEASSRLWLEPENLEQILIDREGLVSEWIGNITPTSDPHLYIAFCGWSPDENVSDRFTHFRYLLQFEISGL
jgi:hypothetical protein